MSAARQPPVLGAGGMEPLPLALGLAALLGLSSALLEVNVGQASISTIQGQRVVLPIWYTSISQSRPYVSWVLERPGANRLQILTYMDGTVKVQETYLKNRTGFVYPMPFFNISIAINNTQEMDSGEYMCTVNIVDEDTINGKNIGLINLTVLVPPSPPTCQIHGKPYLGGNVTMSCKSSFSKPSPKYSWQRTAPNTQVFFAPAQGVRPAGNVNTPRPCPPSLAPGTDSISAFLFREDAVAPKTPSWGKSSSSDIVSKNGTLSSVHTTRDHKLYPSKPASDTASITTAAGSTVGYKPPHSHPRSRTLTPTPSLSSQSLPLYFPPGMNGGHYPSTVPSNRSTLHRTNGAQPQAPRQEPTVPQGLTTSTLTRMGAVPVMVPAQSQAGSLV
ncbi:endothelial cell-selective adhesion molecule [Terrapene carolina triunguis]|uniref:endothelial cell-selective adhesion molecule n=1 Tax=Terrapene triunguis TaxID=2587831 RepID=UPI000E7764A2|nr:endothelial cell-selective adhesion molecule [Terrapene carolina triunguis]